MSYSAKNRFRVHQGFLALMAVFLLSPALARADGPSLAQRCRQFFSGLVSAAGTATEEPATPRRASRVRFSGTSGPIEGTLLADLDEIHVRLENFRRPPNTVVVFEESNRLGHFAYDDLNIHLPRWMAAKVSRADQRLRRSVIQHEYGHAIFIANFGDHSAEWKAWYDSANGLTTGSRRLLRARKPYDLIRLSSPYQELFADLLTVVAQHDPQAMAEPLSEALIFSLEKNGRPIVQKLGRGSASSRSFSATGSDPDWSKPQIDPHHLFSPARRHLWENYFSQERTFREQSAMLRKVFDALATEIMARYDSSSLRNLEPRELNNRVIRALDDALAEYKLK